MAHLLGVAAMGFAFACSVWAQAPSAPAPVYPVKPIRLIVPYAPGGDTDIVARVIAPKLAESLRQQVIVDNRPGAGSLIGTEAMLRAPADGYTLAMGTISSLAVLPVIKASMPYDPLKDIAPVMLATVVPYVLVIHPSMPARTVAELVKLAKSKPGQLSYGTPGTGTGIHLASEYFSSVTGVKLVHVPYKGGAPSIVDLVAGNIEIVISTFSSTGQYLKSGRLRGLAVASAARSKDYPAVPTMAEAGYRGFEASTWHGVVARAGTPRTIVNRLNGDIARILGAEDVRAALVTAGFDVGSGSAEEFERFVRSEIEKWRKVATVANLRID